MTKSTPPTNPAKIVQQFFAKILLGKNTLDKTMSNNILNIWKKALEVAKNM